MIWQPWRAFSIVRSLRITRYDLAVQLAPSSLSGLLMSKVLGARYVMGKPRGNADWYDIKVRDPIDHAYDAGPAFSRALGTVDPAKTRLVLSDQIETSSLKYIKMTASSNFGNVLSVLVASIFLPFLPMLPMHLLVQNLLYDISQIAIPFDNVDEELLKQPQRWQPAEIGRFMVFFGPISSVFDITTFALM